MKIAIVLLSVCASCGRDEGATSATPAPAPSVPTTTAEPTREPARSAAPAELSVVVTAVELFADYQANEIRADQNSGRVAKIGKSDIFDEPVVDMEASSGFEYVSARFESEDTLASLMRGQTIAVRCRGAGMTLGVPSLASCALDLEPSSDPDAFIPDPGKAQRVTIDLQNAEAPPAPEERQGYVDAALAVRNHCRAEKLAVDPRGDLWNTAELVVKRKSASVFVVQARFDDRRKSVHEGRAPIFEIDVAKKRIRAVDEHARALCKL